MNIEVTETMLREAWVAWNRARDMQTHRVQSDDDEFADLGDDEMMGAAITAALAVRPKEQS